jgi:acyl-CoA synthetase (AMP-forming)/AMP-acid ligase II
VLPIDMIRKAARRAPAAIAVEGPGFALGYGALFERVDALAAALQAADPAPQSRVGICAYNTLEHLIALLAVMAAEKTWVPLNPRDARPELDAKIAATRPGILIVDEDCLDKFTPESSARLIQGGELAGLIERHAGRRPARTNPPLDAPQAIKFTGGSSGRPKGVLQPYRAWNAGAASMIHALDLTARDKYLIAAPLTHGTSCYVTPVLAQGGTLALIDAHARPADILDALAARGVTTTFPPTAIYMLMAEADAASRAYPALRNLIFGGASMPPEKIRAAEAVFGKVVAANYGQTEAPQIITFMRPEEFTPATYASAGRAGLMTEVAIMDADRRLAPAETDGEIVLRGDLVMSGYLDMPEQTAATIERGWLHTGDVGALDERGYLFIKDRLRDVVISGGFNVYPSDVEAALVKHPAVHECVVFGLPDEKWGEAVTAAVQLRRDARADADDIIAFAKSQVGSVKAPKRVVFYDDLPRSSVGKVLRREVKEQEMKRPAGTEPGEPS